MGAGAGFPDRCKLPPSMHPHWSSSWAAAPVLAGTLDGSPWARAVYVPSYGVSREYVNTTTVTNVHNRTIVNNNTKVDNVTYVNRNISGAVTAVPQRAFSQCTTCRSRGGGSECKRSGLDAGPIESGGRAHFQ
jgi:hypothetical protein